MTGSRRSRCASRPAARWQSRPGSAAIQRRARQIGRHGRPDWPPKLEMVDTTNWFPKVLRKDFAVGMVVSENGLDDPDQNFYENYACGAARNYGGYCNH